MVGDFLDADKLDALYNEDAAAAAAGGGAPAADAGAAAAGAAGASGAAAADAGADDKKDDKGADAGGQGADDKKDKPDPNKPANDQKNDAGAAPGADPKTDPTKQDPPPPPALQEKEIVTKAQAELLKSLGFTSMDELKAKLNAEPAKAETEEEKQQRIERHTASINKYAVEKNFMTNADLLALNNMNAADPTDLVKKDFTTRYKELYKDRKTPDGDPLKVTDAEIDDAFEDLYHTESDNALLVEEGKKNLAAKAGELKKGLQENFNKAKLQYEDRVMRQDKAKEYFGIVKKLVADFVPPDIVVGEGDDKAVYQFDNEKYNAADKAEVEKLFINDPYFDQFLEHGADAKLLDQFKEHIKIHLRDKHFLKIVDLISKVRADAALRQDSSKVGAKQPFKQAPVDAKPLEVKNNSLSQEELSDLKDTLR